MSKQTNSVDSTKQKRTGFLTGSVLRIREDRPLFPANLAAALLTLDLKSKPEGIRDLINGGYLPESCTETIRPIDVIRLRQKFSARLGVSQRASLRSRDVKIID
jgi:hypothetical protein